jgi:hypothetical protein
VCVLARMCVLSSDGLLDLSAGRFSGAGKLAALVKTTRAAKSLAEGVLGAKLSRHINITGEINSALNSC